MPRLDRHRLAAFVRFTARRFIDDNCFQTAGALAYTSLFALVPVTAATVALVGGFPAFEPWRARITAFVFANFVPAAGDVVQSYLAQFADNASKATAIGVGVLIVSTLMLMLSVEDAFNRIWRVSSNRRAGARLLLYWAVLTMGPLLLAVALAASSYVFALPLVGAADARYSIQAHLIAWLPLAVEWIALFAAYRLIPNRTVAARDAAIGASVAVFLFEAAKRAFAAYVTTGANYELVYGALAVVPIFVLWLYLSWAIVLLGASLTATLTAFDYRPRGARLPPGEEFRGLVRVLAHFAAAQRAGLGLHSAALRAAEPFLTDDLVQRFLGDLARAGMIQRNADGAWVLVRDLGSTTLYELYATNTYRLPLAASLPGSAVPDAADAPLGLAAAGLRNALAVPLAEIFRAAARSESAVDPGITRSEPT